MQLYSSLALQGPSIVCDIKQELAAVLQKEGFESVQQAVGADVQVNAAAAVDA